MTTIATGGPLGRAGVAALVGLIVVGALLTSGDPRGLGPGDDVG